MAFLFHGYCAKGGTGPAPLPLDRPVLFDAITRTQFEDRGHQPDDWTVGVRDREGEEDHAVADQDRCSMPSAQTGPTSTGGDVIMHLLHCPIPIGGDDRMPSLSGSTRPTHRSWGTKHQFGDISWHMHSIFRSYIHVLNIIVSSDRRMLELSSYMYSTLSFSSIGG